MALRRPLIAGLGTTGVLVAFAALLLVVVGALLGFRSWPGDGGVGDAGGITIKDARLTKLAPVTLPVATASRPAAAKASARSTSRRHARRRHGRRAHDAQGIAGDRLSSPAGSGQAPGGAAATTGSGGRPTGSTSQPSVRTVTDGVANTVNKVTETAGGGLGGESTPVGKLVLDTGSAVSKTVQQLGVNAQGSAQSP